METMYSVPGIRMQVVGHRFNNVSPTPMYNHGLGVQQVNQQQFNYAMPPVRYGYIVPQPGTNMPNVAGYWHPGSANNTQQFVNRDSKQIANARMKEQKRKEEEFKERQFLQQQQRFKSMGNARKESFNADSLVENMFTNKGSSKNAKLLSQQPIHIPDKVSPLPTTDYIQKPADWRAVNDLQGVFAQDNGFSMGHSCNNLSIQTQSPQSQIPKFDSRITSANGIGHVPGANPALVTTEVDDEFSDFQSATFTNDAVLRDSKITHDPVTDLPSISFSTPQIFSRKSTPQISMAKNSMRSVVFSPIHQLSQSTSSVVGMRLANYDLGNVADDILSVDGDDFSDFQQAQFQETDIVTTPNVLENVIIGNVEKVDIQQTVTIGNVENKHPVIRNPKSFVEIDKKEMAQKMTTADLMSTSEDKYSALRQLLDEPISDNNQQESIVDSGACDDFGDFVTTTPPANTGWGGTSCETVEDFGDFIGPVTPTNSASCLVQNELNDDFGDFVSPITSCHFRQSENSDNFGDFVSPVISSHFKQSENSDNFGDFVSPVVSSHLQQSEHSMNFGDFVTPASNVSSDWNIGIQQIDSSTSNKQVTSFITPSSDWRLKPTENEPSFENFSDFIAAKEMQQQIEQTLTSVDYDDPFGEFQDSCKIQDDYSEIRGNLTPTIHIPNTSPENQSVCSLEFGVSSETKSNLSRCGSIPSLDLKISGSLCDEVTESEESNISNNKLFVPGAIGDRYSAVRDTTEHDNDYDRHSFDWGRCLQSCLELIQQALTVFNSVSSSNVVKEIMLTEEGNNYIASISEVYQVSYRISVSARKHCSDLNDVVNDVNATWDNLKTFIIGANDLPVETEPSPENDNLEKSCGVCLLNTDNNEDNIPILIYGGRPYHASCANLWVNCIESLLPALPFPSLL